MKYPCLVPKRMCKTDIKVMFESGFDMRGLPKYTVIFDGKCNYQEQQKEVLDKERKLIMLQAVALFPGNIATDEEISGFCEVCGIKRKIYSASRARNPDGTVNYTRLELM